MKQKEKFPDIYKIVYKLSRWKTRSERYFTVFDAQEAFDDFHYAFVSNHVNSNKVHVLDIYKYDRFADKWFSEIQTVTKLPVSVVRTSRGHLTMTRQENLDQR